MGAQWAPVVTQGYFLINVHTIWLEGIAHQLSVNVKYIHTHAPITRISQHTHTHTYTCIYLKYAQQIYIFNIGQGDQRERIPSSGET